MAAWISIWAEEENRGSALEKRAECSRQVEKCAWASTPDAGGDAEINVRPVGLLQQLHRGSSLQHATVLRRTNPPPQKKTVVAL